MLKPLQVGLLACTALMLQGCAYFTNYTREVQLDKTSYALDVKQRVVFSQERLSVSPKTGQLERARVICAEPSPDALTVISASAGVSAANAIAAGANRSNERGDTSASNEANQNVNVTAALAEQGAFVGLRTQSIQLLRDTMYRLCEGYAAGAIPEEEFTAMQRRYQSTMMGLLAIEQLTRPVVAAQVVLASGALAQSGASAGDAAVDKALVRVDEKSKEELAARVELQKAEADERTSRKALDDNAEQARLARIQAESATTSDAAAKKAAGDTAVKPYADARADLQATHQANHQKTGSAALRATVATKARADAEQDLQLAKSRALSSASGQGRIGSIREASAQMTADLAVSVKDIVAEINKSYMRDSCFSLLSSVVGRDRLMELRSPSRSKDPVTGQPTGSIDVLQACVGVIQNEQELIKVEAEASANRSKQLYDAEQARIKAEQDRRQQQFEFNKQMFELEVKHRQTILDQQEKRGTNARKASTPKPAQPAVPEKK